jgi:hypothetical protein
MIMLSIVLASFLALQVTPASAEAPKVWKGAAIQFARFPRGPLQNGSAKLRCRVRQMGGLIGCRFSEASRAEFGAHAVYAAHESRIRIYEGGPQPGDLVEFHFSSQVSRR